MKYNGLYYAVLVLHEVLNKIPTHYEIHYYHWFILYSAYVTRSVKQDNNSV